MYRKIARVTTRLQETIDHLCRDIDKVDEPHLKAMFETSAEVLGGLKKAFSDYEQKNESAWRKWQSSRSARPEPIVNFKTGERHAE